MDGTVPLVVVAELGKGRLVYIHDHDVRVEALAHGDLAVLFKFFECLARLHLEELVVEEILEVFGGRAHHLDIRILRVTKEKNEENDDCSNNGTDADFLQFFQ